MPNPMRRSIAAFVLLAACSPEPSAPIVPAISVDSLLAVPLSVTYRGQLLILEPYLWRDFQPVSPPDGKPMEISADLTLFDGAPMWYVPAFDSVFVVNGTQVWASAVGECHLTSPLPHHLFCLAHNGPKWAPGTSVDVIAVLSDSTRTKYRVRATNVVIARTE